jgi:predicted protein tyrosine phosphatase
MTDENVAAALKNLISALNAANKPPESAAQNQHIQHNPAVNPNAVPAFAQQQTVSNPAAEQTESPVQPVQPIIERTLDTLKNASAIANPENDHRAKLLLSLKPFLKESRQNKIDMAIKYLNAAKILNAFGKNGFV